MSRRPTLRRRLQGIMFRLPGMITCEDFEEFIVDYLEGELAPRQKRIFELHLAICRECRDHLSAYKQAVERAKAVGAEETGKLEDVPKDLVDAILAARR